MNGWEEKDVEKALMVTGKALIKAGLEVEFGLTNIRHCHGGSSQLSQLVSGKEEEAEKS